MKTVVLTDAWKMPATHVRLPKGAIIDLPDEEAENLIFQKRAAETVPSDPVKAVTWVAALVRTAEEDAQKRGKTYRTAYLYDFKRYAKWCEQRGLHPLPASTDTIVRFALHRLSVDGVAEHTARRDVAGITAFHGLTCHPPAHYFLSQEAWRQFNELCKHAARVIAADPARPHRPMTAKDVYDRAYAIFGETGRLELEDAAA